MKAEELWSLCPTCKGQRQITKSEKTGTHSGVTTTRSCDACDGRGITVTETGKVLLEFLRRARDAGIQ